MKPFYLIMVLSWCSAEIKAQGTQTKTASGWQYTSYYPGGQILSIGNFMDSTRHIKNGPMIAFDSSGKPTHFYGYHYNILSGPRQPLPVHIQQPIRQFHMDFALSLVDSAQRRCMHRDQRLFPS